MDPKYVGIQVQWLRGMGYSNSMVDWNHSMLYCICAICYVLVFWGNSLSFGLTVLDYVSHTSVDHGKVKA